MARPRSPNKRLTRFVAPANEDEVGDFKKACAAVEMEPADTIRKLAKAFAAHVKAHGRVVLPLEFAPPPQGQQKPQ